ncbi:MAG: adenosylcobinamide amidohydrolase, partial [Methanoregulaceae archaeon]
MKIPGGEEIEVTEDTLIVRFPEKRCVVSTSWLNGGYREDLTAVFNHQIPLAACDTGHLALFEPVPYLEKAAGIRGLDPKSVAGLLTRAYMRNAAIASESFRDLSVCAIVTAGVDVNGGRAGDPASYYECNGTCEPVGGTINIILVVNAAMPEYAMVRALVTATEAKSAALQQVMAKSCYSSGIATGSGTDMIAVVTNPAAGIRLSDAGKHAKLGELIGNAVIRATLEALDRETGLGPDSQRSVMARLSRYSVTNEVLWGRVQRLNGSAPQGLDRVRFLTRLHERSRDPDLVAVTAASLHIIDEAGWGLLPEEAAGDALIRVTSAGFPNLPG